MAGNDDKATQVEQILDTPNLADALESDRFKQFLDHIPIAICVAELKPFETIIYTNLEFERLTGLPPAQTEGRTWQIIPGHAVDVPDGTPLADAIAARQDYIGAFTIDRTDNKVKVDAWSNIIEDDAGIPVFRLVALVETGHRHDDASGNVDQRIRDKDVLLLELQHRVKNNLQMITALIRLETRNMPSGETGEAFDRLAGRVEALALLYQSLADTHEGGESVDLGVYISQIASNVMQAHAIEGIRLNLQVDTWSASVDVAMPTGLVVNELMTNALKHAFLDGKGGAITLRCLVEGRSCTVIVEDDGVGLQPGQTWPHAGKLSALIVKSLRQNAKADITVVSEPGQGMKVSIAFARADALPAAQ